MRNKALLALAVLLLVGAWAYAQKEATVEGTLVDAKCYLAGGFKGNEHMGMANCGTMCAKGGHPVALVDAKNNYYTLLVAAPKVADLVGKEVRVKGKANDKTRTVAVDKLEVKKNGTWEEVKLGTAM